MKPGFQSELQVKYLGYAGRYMPWKRPFWELMSPLAFSNGLDLIEVPRGFICDLASVPRIPFAYAVFGGTANRAATLHDYMYREGYDRKRADDVFYDAMLLTGYGEVHAGAMYAAVRVFGRFAYRPRPGVLDGRL